MDTLINVMLISTLAQLAAGVNRRRRKVYHRRTNPFDTLDDIDFKNRYRFTKPTVRRIVNLIRRELLRDRRGGGISPELQVLVALRCWARCEVQDDAGELHGLSQPTVSIICARVARALAGLRKNYIKMPRSLQEQQNVMREFRTIKGFPNVIGAIDCTHIKIKKTGGDAAQYYINRKGYYSLNVQVVCDAKLKIRDIVARWRGSTHDARIFNESSLKERFEADEFRGILLGDSGYACTSYLFTPLLNPQNPQEQNYNEAHIATRNPVVLWSLETALPLFINRHNCVIEECQSCHHCTCCSSQYCYTYGGQF